MLVGVWTSVFAWDMKKGCSYTLLWISTSVLIPHICPYLVEGLNMLPYLCLVGTLLGAWKCQCIPIPKTCWGSGLYLFGYLWMCSYNWGSIHTCPYALSGMWACVFLYLVRDLNLSVPTCLGYGQCMTLYFVGDLRLSVPIPHWESGHVCPYLVRGLDILSDSVPIPCWMPL